jgi:hypothetical protein
MNTPAFLSPAWIKVESAGKNRISTSLSNPVISPVDEDPVTLEAPSLTISNKDSELYDDVRNTPLPGSLAGNSGDSDNSSPAAGG